MSFNGAQISGGTFYHVAGNMTQISNNSTLVSVPATTIQGPGAQGFLASAMTSNGIGRIGPDRGGRQGRIAHRPYDDSSRNARSTQHAGPTDPDIPEGPTAGPVPHHLFQTLQATPGGGFYDPRYTNATAMPNIPNHTFTSVGGNVVTSYGETGMNILYRYVAMEALHDSGERFPEPACHPGTRTQILEDLRAWSIDTTPESTLLWLYGSAGVGKSAIAQMFAGDCQSRNHLGASFFFRRGHPRRGTWNNLFPTIAYQLAHSVSELFLPIQQAVENDKLVVGRAMATHFQKLIIEPFGKVPGPEFRPIIILDGLDECEDHKVQQQILRLFIRAIRASQLPIHILIVSRPEPHIREVFETTEASAICGHSMLSADGAAYEDIRIYLRDEFSRIHAEYKSRGIDLGSVWPSADEIYHLVQKSSGIFIYAATIIRFVEDEYSHPADRLESILSLDPQSTAPLDDLYTKILSALPQEQKELRILHTLWRTLDMDALECIDPEGIDMLLDLHRGTCRITLRALESLFSVPAIRHRLASPENIQFLHASFSDYLCDPRRSGQWCVSVPWLRSDYLHSMIRMLSTPPVTFNARDFYSDALCILPHLLKDECPSEGLITMMRNQTFQHSLFLNVDIARWPKEDSQYPRELIQLWEDHSFIDEFISNLRDPRHLSDQPPTFQFDWIYQEIFGQHPTVLAVLRILTIRDDLDYIYPSHLSKILRLHCLTFRIFQPFAQFRQILQFPFPEGDLPLDFLTDPVRAGVLYRNPDDIAEEFLLLWIHQAKEVLEGQSDFQLWG
ncbi:hypothetical protein DFH07DRAFT_294224 [Mycena maculata]|uniref:Nephrocystin 3-like N-terminal domain-containing protein n=1 Tax=Mycena maculata TaxID=230809 RepID=A0AAD7ML19_9AGAR|nr:hypothetical protein DFH07DRAFT_294224 [Mycena maculata]